MKMFIDNMYVNDRRSQFDQNLLLKTDQGQFSIRLCKTWLEKVYSIYTTREVAENDPVKFLYEYQDPVDKEIVAFLASSLAYGRIKQILKSITWILGQMGLSPSYFLKNSSYRVIEKTFGVFNHRFTTGKELANILISIKEILDKLNSLSICYENGYCKDHDSVIPSLTVFVKTIISLSSLKQSSLLPDPEKGSACKRLNLFLRWMVRNDCVDHGVWNFISTSQLIVPLDTHIHRISLAFGLTKRKNTGIDTAIDITKAMKKFSPDDPVKYDFALSHFGMENYKDLQKIDALCMIGN